MGVEISNLFVKYGNQSVLEDINLKIEDNRLITIIGVNGCGKTSLLNAICGSLNVECDIFINNKNLKDYKRNELAKTLAILPQNRNVPDISVERFVGHGRFPHLDFDKKLNHHDRKIIADAMAQTDVFHLRNKNIKNLSGGERQRVYLAMTLAQDTPIIFLDEPCTFLDIGKQFELLELISKISKNKTIIMVLHDIPLALKYSHEIIVLNNKKLAIHSTSEKVYESKLIDKLFDISCKKIDIDGEDQFFCHNKSKL